MARIPRADNLSGDARLSGGVVRIPVVPESDAMGRVLKQAGDELTQFGFKLQQAKVDKENIEASRKTREELDREYRKLEQSGDIDPAEFETRYKEATDKIIETNAGMLSSKQGRALWSQRAQSEWQSEGILRTRSLKRNRDLEGARAGLISENAAVGKLVGDPAVERSTVEAAVEAQRGHITRQAQGGLVGKDDAARLIADLDITLDKDRMIRTGAEVEGLVREGRSDEADKVIALSGATTDEQSKLRQVKQRVEQDIRIEKQIAEAEVRKGQELVKSQYYVDIWKGEVSDADIEKAAADGRISPNDRPELMAARRSYQNSLLAETAMSAAEKARLVDISKDARSELQAMTVTRDGAARYLEGPNNWRPSEQEKYLRLSVDDRRAVLEDISKMAETGKTAKAADSLLSDLVEEAKRVAPENWKIGTKDQKAEGDKLLGILRTMAIGMSEEAGGKALTVDEQRKTVSRALTQLNAKKFPLSGENERDDYWKNLGKDQVGVDFQKREAVRNDLIDFLGRVPTEAELEKAMEVER